MRINVLMGTTLIVLIDGVFYHIFESQVKCKTKNLIPEFERLTDLLTVELIYVLCC